MTFILQHTTKLRSQHNRLRAAQMTEDLKNAIATLAKKINDSITADDAATTYGERNGTED